MSENETSLMMSLSVSIDHIWKWTRFALKAYCCKGANVKLSFVM